MHHCSIIKKSVFTTGFAVLTFLGTAVFTSCGETPDEEVPTQVAEEQPAETPPTVLIQAEDFSTVSEGVSKVNQDDQSYANVAAAPAWLTFNVDVPEAGRYKIEINASAEGEVSAWIEDYVDNKDDRTYNITGKIPLTSTTNDFTVQHKDGSPLNAGQHQMKLHVEGGAAQIDWIKLTLLKKHQKTPQLLTQKTDGENWEIVWADEFDEDGSPNMDKWTYDIGDWGWGNNELQYYTENASKNARQENGHLIIEAHKNDGPHEWSSARLTTRGKTSFLYGRIEIKAKVPAQRGNWAAGWTLGDEYVDELSWPYCGEIDILETVGYEMDDATGDGKAHASIHCGAYYFKLGNQPTANTPVKNMEKEFHVYAIDWTPEGITASVDGETYFEYNDTSTELAWPYSKPQNLILNLAMGGGWGGAEGMDENMTSQKYVIDYVRVYEKK